MRKYKEIPISKFREVICFSVIFYSFFGGKLYYTGEFFGIKKIKQQRFKTEYLDFNEYNSSFFWREIYKWKTI